MPTRETELYKDKIEVSLDGRQIFYLFFGGAVIVGLVFVLGVMVGRRVEARGHLDHARTQAAADPLAALDRLEGSGSLSFQASLTGNAATSDVERAIGEIDRARQDKAAAKDAAAKPGSKPEKAPEKAPEKVPEKPTKADAKVTAAGDAKKKDEKKPAKIEKPEKKAEKTPEKPDVKTAGEVADKKPDEKAVLDDKKESGDKKVAKADEATETKTKFTLQLSSFQDRAEAEAFLSSIKSSGYEAYLTEATVSGKGTFYRVRLGTYRSMDAANNAKADFEKSSKKSASIMRL